MCDYAHVINFCIIIIIIIIIFYTLGIKNPEGFGKKLTYEIVKVTITPDSPHEQTNREAECC